MDIWDVIKFSQLVLTNVYRQVKRICMSPNKLIIHDEVGRQSQIYMYHILPTITNNKKLQVYLAGYRLQVEKIWGEVE